MFFFKGDCFGAKDFHRMACSIELTFSADVFLEPMSVLNRIFQNFHNGRCYHGNSVFPVLLLCGIRYQDSLCLKHSPPCVKCMVKI